MALVQSVLPATAAASAASLAAATPWPRKTTAVANMTRKKPQRLAMSGFFTLLPALARRAMSQRGRTMNTRTATRGLMSLISIVGTSDLSDVFIRRCQAARWAGEE